MKNQIITILDTHPVLLNTLQPGYDLAVDWTEGTAEMRRILDAHPTPLYIVDDVTALRLSLDDLIVAANLIGRGDTPLYQHPNALGIYFVSDSKPVEIAAKGLNSPIFGHLKTKVFPSLEDALAHIELVSAR